MGGNGAPEPDGLCQIPSCWSGVMRNEYLNRNRALLDQQDHVLFIHVFRTHLKGIRLSSEDFEPKGQVQLPRGILTRRHSQQELLQGGIPFHVLKNRRQQRPRQPRP